MKKKANPARPSKAPRPAKPARKGGSHPSAPARNPAGGKAAGPEHGSFRGARSSKQTSRDPARRPAQTLEEFERAFPDAGPSSAPTSGFRSGNRVNAVRGEAQARAPMAPRDRLDLASLSAEPWLPTEEFLSSAKNLGIEFEEHDLPKLGSFLALLSGANELLNLTSITEPGASWMRHILDSLTLLPVVAELPALVEQGESDAAGGTGLRMIDVGTGGGLPGLPLAIVCPNLRVTLLDSTAKKCDFLRHVAQRLALSNVEVLCGRAEAVGHDRGQRDVRNIALRQNPRREAYDLVTARAVGRLATLLELTVPFAKKGGTIALIKGAKGDEELEEAKPAMHLLKCVHVTTLETPTGRVMIFEKGALTPRDYPRRDGEPARAPLGVGSADPGKQKGQNSGQERKIARQTGMNKPRPMGKPRRPER